METRRHRQKTNRPLFHRPSTARHQLDEWVQKSVSKSGNQSCKGCACDHTDGQINDIAAQDEISESIKHVSIITLHKDLMKVFPGKIV